jgi:hypothetical protein
MHHRETGRLPQALAAIAPDRLDARHIGCGVGHERVRLHRTAHVHRQFAPQRLKTCVHLRSNRACMRPHLRIARPQAGLGKLFRQVFKDRQRFPDTRVALDQHRHLPGPAQNREARFEIRRVEWNHRFLKCDPRDLHRQPRSERPGRVVFVADGELKTHGRSVPRSSREN